MNTNFIICSDSAIDCSEEFFVNNNIKAVEHGIVIDEQKIFDGFCKKITEHDIFKMLREGKNIYTLHGNEEQMYKYFEQAVSEKIDVLYICFASALSDTYEKAYSIAKEVMDKYPNSKITVVDSKCVGAGQGILLRKCLEKKAQGISYYEMVQYVMTEREYIHHYGVIDNLEFLKKDDKISKTTVFMGSIVGAKPIIHLAPSGKIEIVSKLRGVAKVNQFIIEQILEKCTDEVYISHCDNLEYAENLKKLILEKTEIKNVNIYYLSNTISCHVGINAIAVYFKGIIRK